MDFKQLTYFSKVAELGSFTRASNVLNVGQPVLSRHIRLLEVELRQNLLVRNGRGVTTTEAGELLLKHCRGILHQVERAREELGRVRGTLAGRVAVGLPPSISKLMTVRLTREFKQRLPNAQLSISEGLSGTMVEWLRAGRLDIALIHNLPPANEFDITPLSEEPLYLISARDESDTQITNPIELKDLARLPLITPNHPHVIRAQLETHLAQLKLKPYISLEIDGVQAILDLVAHAVGHAVLTRYAVTTSARPDAYTIRPIIEPALKSQLYMATASGRITTLTQNAVLDLIQDVSKELFV